jgi:Zn-dependent M28 family amino/carboxypeptidase
MRLSFRATVLLLAITACGDRRPVPAASGGEVKAQTAFSGEAALAYTRQAMNFGTRVPGSEGHRRAGDWIVAQMRERADTVIVQEWAHVTADGDTLPMRNILARFRPDAAERVLYLTHWDTRPVSESDSDPDRRQLPLPGANDGTSGIGLFLALGDVLKRTPPSVGVDILFVDGEDYGNFDENEDVFIGSRYFANNLPSPGYRPIFGVLWDMIADRELNIYQEPNSVDAAPEVVSRVWETARKLGYDQYFIPQRGGVAINDDHIPLIEKGLRVIDVIDFDYGPGNAYHHTQQDTIDKLSARSFQIVGDVATALVTR